MDFAMSSLEAVLSLLLLPLSFIFWLAAWISFFVIPSGKRFYFSLFFLHLPVILLLALLILCYTTDLADHPFSRNSNIYYWLAGVLSLPSIYFAVPCFRSGCITVSGQKILLISGFVCTLTFAWGIFLFLKTFAV